MLLLTCSEILSRYINDTVGIDIECNLNLRNTSHCRRDTVESELSEGLVVAGKLSLTLYYVNINCGLIVGCG